MYRFIVTVMLVALLSISASAQTADQSAAPAGGMQMGAGSMGSGAGMDMMAMCMQHHQDLGLTDDQLRRIRNIQLDAMKQIIPIAANIQLAQVDLMQMMLQDSVDSRRVESQARKIGGYVGDLYAAGIRAMLAARDVLTPDQRKRVEAMLSSGQAGMAKGCMCGCPCCGMQGMAGMQRPGSAAEVGGAQAK